MLSDIVMCVGIYDKWLRQDGNYRMVIRLNCDMLPCDSVHFRVASKNFVLGDRLHMSFVPPALYTAASLPFLASHCFTAVAP